MTGELSCQETVEVVTDYVKGVMPPKERQRFEHHLSYCPGWVAYVEQIRATIRATGALPHEETLSPALRVGLVERFKDWQRSP